MKKRFILLVLSLLILVIFSCDLTIPTAIEIKGTPKVRFKENINIGEIFKDKLDDAINENSTEGMTIISCKNTDDFTFLIHMELFNEEFNLDDLTPELPSFPGINLGDLFVDLIDNKTVTLPSERDLIKPGLANPMVLPLSSIGSLLDGFEFDGYKIKLYFSGSDIINKVKIDMQIGTGTPVTEVPNGQKCDIESWKNAKTPLSDGVDITLPLSGQDSPIYFRVYLPKDTVLKTSDFKSGKIKVEVVVWLPFVLKATKDADITLPLFDSSGDLFGREGPGAKNVMTDIIESLKLEINFDNNPFQNTKLIVSSKGINIENPFINKSFTLDLSKENITKINSPENYPFTPEFKLRFNNGSVLKLPKEFNITDLIFTANIKYRMDL